ncbi:MAG: hypothetical protein NTV49_16400 [Kiritimatiellaeota bacterium]|nr:hypothetical protein [Kiritimatiellota bacterium]
MAIKKQSSDPAGAARAALWLIYGEDEFRVKTAARQRVDELCPPADQAFGLEIVNGSVANADEAGAALKRCLGALRTRGFLGGRKVVWLQDANFFADSQTLKGNVLKEHRDAFARELKKGLGADVALVISAFKVDGRSAFAKACKDLGELTPFERPEKSYQQEGPARAWATECFQRASLRAGGEVLEAFLDRAGYDTRQIAQEVGKLAIYLGDRKELRLDDIRLLVAPAHEAESWDLPDAVGRRQLAEALAICRQLLLQDPKSCVGLIIGLEARCRELTLHRDALDRGWLRLVERGEWKNAEWRSAPDVDAAFSVLDKDPRKTHPYRTAQLAQQARNFTRAELQRGLEAVVVAHETILAGASAPETLLELLLLKLLRPVKP